MWMKSSPCGQLQPLEDTRRETTQARLGVHTSSYHGPTQLLWPYMRRSLVTVHNGTISIK